MKVAIIIIICIVVVLFVLYYLFPPVQVCGDSMYPTYIDGEIIFGTKLYRKSKLKKGDVILYKSPKENRTVIKRIDHIIEVRGITQFYCLGDNVDHSYDSRYYGFISSKKLVCKVINQRRYNNETNCSEERWNS